MGDIVSLSKVKEQAARKAARSLADANALKFGRTKAERSLLTAQDDKAARDLDGHRREPGNGALATDQE